MIGADTGLVVSLFVKDDPRQHRAARTFFSERHEEGSIFICSAVVLEAVWTLKALYGYDEAAMKRMLLSLCSLKGTVVEHMDAIFAWASDDSATADLADVLIAAANKKNGCARTVTFDKGAAHDVSGLELLA